MADYRYFAMFHMHLIKTQTTGLSLLFFFFVWEGLKMLRVSACCYKIFPISLLLTQYEGPCPDDFARGQYFRTLGNNQIVSHGSVLLSGG